MSKPQQSKYAKASSASAQRGSNYPRPGHYALQILGVEEGQGGASKTDQIAVRYRTLAVYPDSRPGFDYGLKKPLTLHAEGEEFADIIKTANIAAAQRQRALAEVAGGLTQEDFDNEAYPGALIEEMVGDDQPLAGVVVEARVELKVKRTAASKEESDLNGTDVYHSLVLLRRIPFSELSGEVKPEVLAKWVPDLDEKIAAEAESEG